jgi:hypothetical protein
MTRAEGDDRAGSTGESGGPNWLVSTEGGKGMAAGSILELDELERSLIHTLKTLHPRRAAEVLDFARWLQTQPVPDEPGNEVVTEQELEAEESAWEASYLANRDAFRAMAREALSELDAGETMEITLENGGIRPR